MGQPLSGLVPAALNCRMRKPGRAHDPIKRQTLRFDAIGAFQRALDNRYRRMCESARQQRERHFSSNDPNDACVSVRRGSVKPGKQFVPAAAILPACKSRSRGINRKLIRPRFAI